LPHFGRIVLQPCAGDGPEKELMPYFVLSSRAKQRHGLTQKKAELVASKRMHVAKVNHVAIATACGLDRDVVTTGVKELLWCLLEAMANKPQVLIDVGVGDMRSQKRSVEIAFDREPGKGSTMPAMAPLTAQSESAMSRLSLSSSASTLRPPSAAGTEIDWDSLAMTGKSMAPDEPTIEEGDEGEDEGGTTLPPIPGAEATADAEVAEAMAEEDEVDAKERSASYIENHKASKSWTENFTQEAGPHDSYLNNVFDRFEDALLRSEQQLKQEAMEVEQAAAAEEELRQALATKKQDERNAVARSLKTQMKLREKELERARLEAMIVGEPSFPDTERGLLNAEDQKKEALKASLDAQVQDKAARRAAEDRYDRCVLRCVPRTPPSHIRSTRHLHACLHLHASSSSRRGWF
jgi:hypothetical protein